MNPLGLDPTRFTVACTSSGDVAGFVQLVQHNEKVTELRSLYVLPPHRNKGVGRELVRLMLQQANGKSTFLLTPTQRTTFYECCGFEACTPWELPWFMLPDVAIGAAVLAAVAKDTIVGMVHDPK